MYDTCCFRRTNSAAHIVTVMPKAGPFSVRSTRISLLAHWMRASVSAPSGSSTPSSSWEKGSAVRYAASSWFSPRYSTHTSAWPFSTRRLPTRRHSSTRAAVCSISTSSGGGPSGVTSWAKENSRSSTAVSSSSSASCRRTRRAGSSSVPQHSRCRRRA